MDTFGRSTRPRGFFEAALAIHISPLSTIVRHGILDERFLMADYFMPLPETSAVKDRSESGGCHESHASVTVHDADCEGYAT